jgi:hypothetical protein
MNNMNRPMGGAPPAAPYGMNPSMPPQMGGMGMGMSPMNMGMPPANPNYGGNFAGAYPPAVSPMGAPGAYPPNPNYMMGAGNPAMYSNPGMSNQNYSGFGAPPNQQRGESFSCLWKFSDCFSFHFLRVVNKSMYICFLVVCGLSGFFIQFSRN